MGSVNSPYFWRRKVFTLFTLYNRFLRSSVCFAWKCMCHWTEAMWLRWLQRLCKPESVHRSPRKWHDPVAHGPLTTVPNEAEAERISLSITPPLRRPSRLLWHPPPLLWVEPRDLFGLGAALSNRLSKIDPRELDRASVYLLTCAWSLVEKL